MLSVSYCRQFKNGSSSIASPVIVIDFLFVAVNVTSTYAATVGIAYGTLSEKNALQNQTTLNDSYVSL